MINFNIFYFCLLVKVKIVWFYNFITPQTYNSDPHKIILHSMTLEGTGGCIIPGLNKQSLREIAKLLKIMHNTSKILTFFKLPPPPHPHVLFMLRWPPFRDIEILGTDFKFDRTMNVMFCLPEGWYKESRTHNWWIDLWEQVWWQWLVQEAWWVSSLSRRKEQLRRKGGGLPWVLGWRRSREACWARPRLSVTWTNIAARVNANPGTRKKRHFWN